MCQIAMQKKWEADANEEEDDEAVNQSILNESAEEVEPNMSLHDFHASE
jgi:hypothetical protein